MEKSIDERKTNLMRKVYRLLFGILLIFGIPAIPGYFIGEWLDLRYDMRPLGSLIALVVSAIISWAIMIRVYLNIRQEYKQIEADEQKNEAETTKDT